MSTHDPRRALCHHCGRRFGNVYASPGAKPVSLKDDIAYKTKGCLCCQACGVKTIAIAAEIKESE